MPEKSKEIPYITRDVPEEPYEVFKDPKIIQHIHASMIQAGIPKEQVFVASYRSGTISISLKGLGQISFDLNTHYIKSG